MLRRTLLTLCLMVMALTVTAQVGEYRSEWAFGVSGGVALNRVSFSPTVNQRFHAGPTMGVTARYTCEKYYSIICAFQAELNYSELGWNEKILSYDGTTLPDRYQRHHHYLQLPLLARLALGREHPTQGKPVAASGYLVAGPQIGFCIGESTSQSDTWTTRTASIYDDNGDVVQAEVPDRANNRYEQYSMPIERRFDYGITGGLGLALATPAGDFLLEGRYYFGLYDIFSNSKKDTFARSANGSIMVKLTYLLPYNTFKKKKKK